MRRSLAALIVGAMCVAGLGSAAALNASPSRAAGTPGADGALVVVLDASGSMAEPTAGGGSRMAAAQSAAGVVIGGIPAGNRVGLRVFGASMLAGQPGACTDSQLLVPIATDNRHQLRSAIDGIAPYGETPIGFALQQAEQDLGDSGQRAILLVSDGIANCEPDPCVVAGELAQGDMQLRIDVIGFDVDAAARQQLECVADRGRGDYLDVSEAASLQHALERLSDRAFRPFNVVGEAVVGTADAESAPTLRPGVQYVDAVRTTSDAARYLVRRTTPGSVVHVGLAGRLPHDGSLTVEASLSTPTGEPCDATSIAALSGDRFSVFSGRLSAAEGSPEHTCATAEALVLTLEATVPPPVPVAFELRIREQPWPDVEALPPPVDAERGWSLAATPDAAAGAVVGGSSLNDAPLVRPGSYSTDMLPSEFQFFRVHADWGQTVRVDARLDPDLPAPPNAWGILQVLDPVGADVAALLATTADGTRWSQTLPEPGAAVATTTSPVRFDANPGLVRRALMDGEHVVAVGFGADAGAVPARLLVTIEVVGEVSGAPGASGRPTAAGDRQEPGTASDAADLAAVPWPFIATMFGIGLVLIALVALAVWLVQRRGRRSFDR
ncbi:vWA domain-containing protein [Agrococcus lahaulensis]|uniref:vWA domain-containing protein n=1 Tax=Agrococcus lahaulensis TaxID=341722 RepID=UPI00042333FC|nr:VWA domain-containing protein [Agrococcus lahaulensis]